MEDGGETGGLGGGGGSEKGCERSEGNGKREVKLLVAYHMLSTDRVYFHHKNNNASPFFVPSLTCLILRLKSLTCRSLSSKKASVTAIPTMSLSQSPPFFSVLLTGSGSHTDGTEVSKGSVYTVWGAG